MADKKNIVIFFGGIAPEHEVSIISGLQVVEKIDREKYSVFPVYVSKIGELLVLPNLVHKKDFFTTKRYLVNLGTQGGKGVLQYTSPLLKKITVDAAYLAFHGGMGESGGFQGLCEVLGIPYTSATVEGSAIAMNKQVTKEVLLHAGISVVPGKSFTSATIKSQSESIANELIATYGLPLIVKPVHLGSSIGLKVVRSSIELEKALLTASYIDSEVMVEKFLENMKEYNCAVRMVRGILETSEIEKPMGADEILSFADKYQKGGAKKTGTSNGMASLQRELPAKITVELKQRIEQIAKNAFTAARLKGMVRIDFMYTPTEELFLTEINPIPGSLAFYLWEAAGIQFKQQITDLIEQSIIDDEISRSRRIDYETDIVRKFVNN